MKLDGAWTRRIRLLAKHWGKAEGDDHRMADDWYRWVRRASKCWNSREHLVSGQQLTCQRRAWERACFGIYSRFENENRQAVRYRDGWRGWAASAASRMKARGIMEAGRNAARNERAVHRVSEKEVLQVRHIAKEIRQPREIHRIPIAELGSAEAESVKRSYCHKSSAGITSALGATSLQMRFIWASSDAG